MVIFFNRAAQHLVETINLPKAHFIIKQFSDGEVYVKIDPDVKQKEIWVIASTEPPAENLLELFFLLDALVRANVKKINIFFPYFGYARQAIASPGEASSAELICDILKKFPCNKIFIMHAHDSPILQTFLPFKNVIDMGFFCNIAKHYDIIAAPDKGAAEFAQKVSTVSGKEIIFLEKCRPTHETVLIKAIDGNALGKKVLLVDDIISTGHTIIEASKTLIELGALEVSAAATHGIFSQETIQRLNQSSLKKIYVTNTLKQSPINKINIVDISKFIELIILNKVSVD